MKLNIKGLPEKVNKIYLEQMFKSQKRFLVIFGSSGSSKSVSVAQMILLKMLIYDINVLCVRQIHKTIKFSVKKNLEGQIKNLNLSSFFKVTRDQITAINGATIIFSGLDDIEKLKSIADIDLIWAEEATEISSEAFREFNRRIRGIGKKKQIVFTLNPCDYESWIRYYFFSTEIDPDKGISYSEIYKNYRENALILHTTYKDNRFLDDEYINQMKNEQDEHNYNIFTLGQWSSRVEGYVFDRKRIRKDVIPTLYTQYDKILIGVDFGHVHASTYIVVGLKDKEPDNIYIIDEVYIKNTTRNEFIDIILTDTDCIGRMIYCDSAEPATIKSMCNQGLIAEPVNKFNNSIKFSIDWLKNKNIIISNTCINTYGELINFSYKKDRKTGRIIDDYINTNDDCIAGLRYAIMKYASSGLEYFAGTDIDMAESKFMLSPGDIRKLEDKLDIDMGTLLS